MQWVCGLWARLHSGLGILNRGSLFCAKLLVIGLLGSLTFIVLLQVFCRYVLNSALGWPEEVAKFLMVWMTLLAAPIAYRTGGHVGITLLPAALGEKARAALLAGIDLCLLGLTLVLTVVSVQITRIGMMTRGSSIDLPMAYVYAAFPVGMVMLGFVVLESFVGHTEAAAGAITLRRSQIDAEQNPDSIEAPSTSSPELSPSEQ